MVEYRITTKGKKVTPSSFFSLRFPGTGTASFTGEDILVYLKKRKTPATLAEIYKGANLKGYSKKAELYFLGHLLEEGYIKKERLFRSK